MLFLDKSATEGTMGKHWVLVLALFLSFCALPAVAEEGPRVDFIFLVDVSLSMVPGMEALKTFLIHDIINRFIKPGDWAAVIAFHRESQVVWEGEITSDAQKLSLVTSIKELEANRRLTDIGLALDSLNDLIIDRNQPEIPKYILLLTDEVQEAPPESRYHSNYFTIRHNLLNYIHKVDMDSFYAITIGYDLADRIESEIPGLVKTMRNPANRTLSALPEAALNDIHFEYFGADDQRSATGQSHSLPSGTGGNTVTPTSSFANPQQSSNTGISDNPEETPTQTINAKLADTEAQASKDEYANSDTSSFTQLNSESTANPEKQSDTGLVADNGIIESRKDESLRKRSYTGILRGSDRQTGILSTVALVLTLIACIGTLGYIILKIGRSRSTHGLGRHSDFGKVKQPGPKDREQ
jgi:hypothetical protein